MKVERIDNWRLKIPRQGKMNVDAMVYCDPGMHIEENALAQLMDTASLPSVEKALATPDIHLGYGAPIGAVVGLKDYICPAAVGYDVNCGMRLMTTPFRADKAPVLEIARAIFNNIPLGEGKSGSMKLTPGQLRQVLERGVKGMYELKPLGGQYYEAWDDAAFGNDIAAIEDEGSMTASSVFLSQTAINRGLSQLGTLGGGNHFIEMQRVVSVEDVRTAKALGIEKDALVIMIHSGSRGFGHQVGEDHMPQAWKLYPDESPNRFLGVYPINSDAGQHYLDAMRCAANYAFANRQAMANAVRLVFRAFSDEPLKTVYDVAHNIAKKEVHFGKKLWVHRKGATRAFPAAMMKHAPFAETGQPVLIPGSMGTSSYLLVGTPQADESLYSVNHGAGRVMSRTTASGKGRRGKRVEAAISDAEFKSAMHGIHLLCSNRDSIKEEAPQAYKDIDNVVRAVVGANLARVVARMLPLAVLKG